MKKYRERNVEEDEIVFKEIVNKLDNYRSIASDYGVEINTKQVHNTHGVLYYNFDFTMVRERNLNSLLGLDSEKVLKTYDEFYESIYHNILNVDEISEKFKILSEKFFNREIDHFRVRNVLYKRNNELLYLDVSFSLFLEDSFVIFVDDVTGYVKDKLLLEEFAIHNNILVKEVHHRVKNNLQILLSLISIQQRFGYNDSTIADYMKLSISSMALIHNQLYGDNLDYVSLKVIINDFASNIDNFYGNLDIKFSFKTVGDVSLSIDKSNPLFLILNELIINSIKHAFDENDKEKFIGCTFERIEDNLIVTYKDNGKGLEDIEENEMGLGHVLIDSLIGQIDGKYKITSNNGYNMKITMPLNK